MRFCTVLALTEEIRRRGGGGSAVVLNLTADAGIVRRRAAAVYSAVVSLSWLPGAYFLVVTDTGYPKKMTFAQIAALCVTVSNGAHMSFTVDLPDAAKLPAVWTAARLASLAGKVAQADLVGMRARAQSKRETALTWEEDGPRRVAVLAAADVMDGAAAFFDGVLANGAGGYGVDVPDLYPDPSPG